MLCESNSHLTILAKEASVENVKGEHTIRVLDEDGNLTIDLTAFYILLKYGLARLYGPNMIIDGSDLIRAYNCLKRTTMPRLPTIDYCPSDEPIKIHDLSDELSNLCTEVYRFLNDKCAACVIKVYSLAANEWLIDSKELVKLLDLSIEYNLSVEFRRGCIILSSCPSSYEEVNNSYSYVDGLKVLKRALTHLNK